MTAAIWTVVAAVFQISLLVLQQWANKINAQNQAKSSQSKEISDASASGDVARINSVVNKLRS